MDNSDYCQDENKNDCFDNDGHEKNIYHYPNDNHENIRDYYQDDDDDDDNNDYLKGDDAGKVYAWHNLIIYTCSNIFIILLKPTQIHC